MSESSAGVPDTARGRETRARIVERAAKLMHLRGVGATSIDDVLAASGTGKGQMYHYFSDKEELVEAVLLYQLDRVLGIQNRFELGTWDGLRSWFDAMLDEQEARGFAGGCPLGSIVAEVSARDDSLRSTAAEAFARWESAFATGLTVLQDRGELRNDADPERLAAEAMASIQGGYLLSTIKRARGPMQYALEAALDRIESYAQRMHP